MDYYRDDFNAGSLSDDWTVSGSWALSSGALALSETGTTESKADNDNALGKGDIEVATTINLNSNAHVGLQVLNEDGGGPGYEFAVKRDGATVTGYIYRLDASRNRTEVASGALTATFTSNRGYRLKGRIRRAGQEGSDVPISLSLYFDDEDTAELTYTDRYVGAGFGANYFAISGQKADSSGGDCAIYLDSFIARRLMQVELPETWVESLWTWARLRDNALSRLESFGNPQMAAEKMLEFLGFAESELVERCNKPYWLDRVYSLTTSSFQNALPAWIDLVDDAVDETHSQHLPILSRAEFNFKHPGRESTGDPTKLIFLGLDDYQRRNYYIYPTPSGSVTLTLYVKGRSGYIQDANMVPLVPPKFVEILIFGALRRALVYDDDHQAKWQMNERLWQGGIQNVLRDDKLVKGRNVRMHGERESAKIHRGLGSWQGIPSWQRG